MSNDNLNTPNQTDGRGPIAIMFIGAIIFCVVIIALLPNNRHRLREAWMDKASEQDTKN